MRFRVRFSMGVAILALYAAVLLYWRSWMETKALVAFGGAVAPLFMHWAAVCFWLAAHDDEPR